MLFRLLDARDYGARVIAQNNPQAIGGSVGSKMIGLMRHRIARLLDDTGWRVLIALQENARMPFAELPSLPIKRVAELALKYRMPTVSAFRPFAEDGGLMSYWFAEAEVYRRAAVFADKILKGAKPSELPIEQPTKFELVINLKTAKALGLTIPPSLLLRADQVIE